MRIPSNRQKDDRPASHIITLSLMSSRIHLRHASQAGHLYFRSSAGAKCATPSGDNTQPNPHDFGVIQTARVRENRYTIPIHACCSVWVFYRFVTGIIRKSERVEWPCRMSRSSWVLRFVAPSRCYLRFPSARWIRKWYPTVHCTALPTTELKLTPPPNQNCF